MAKGQASRMFVWVLLGLLIVGLAGFGATNFGGSVRSVATVGGTEVDVDRYARELQSELRAITAEVGRAIPLTEAQGLGIPQNVLARLVTQAALEEEARVRGLSVGDETVRDEILAIPAFQGVDGSFDRESYAFVLESNGLSVAEFEERVRAETAAGLIRRGLLTGARMPDAYTDTIYAFAAETRNVTWAALTEADLSEPVPEPTEADLAAFHEANPERFTAPETRAITYAWMTPEMLAETVEVDEGALRALYEQRIDDYVQPERRLVERLVFADTAAAEAALAAITAGETTFDALVEDRGLTLDDIDMGDLSEADLGAAGAAVFALEGPGIAGPVETSLGPALFRVNAVLAARDVSFEEAREELAPEAAVERAARIIADQVTDLEDLLAAGATVEELAAESEMDLGTIDWHADVDEGIAGYDGFRAAAAAAREGDFPEIVTLDEGGVFALRLDAVRPPALRPLDEVRDEVEAAWYDAEITARLMDQAEAAAARIAAGESFEALGLTPRAERGIPRDGFIEGTPGAFVGTVFDMGDAEARALAGEAGAVVVRVDGIVSPDQTSDEARRLKAAFTERAMLGLAGDLAGAFTRSLQLDHGIEVNQTAINAVHAQFP